MKMRLFIFSAGVVLGALVTSFIASRRIADGELRYTMGYRDGWFEVVGKLAKHFESRQPKRDEHVLDHLWLKNYNVYIVEKDHVTTLVYSD